MKTKTPKLTPLLLLLFTSFIISSNSAVQGVDFDYTSNTAFKNVELADTTSQFRLDFEKGIPRNVNYMKVEVTVTNGQPAPLLYFSSTDDTCAYERQQISKSPNEDSVFLWLKTEEFEEGDLFVVVECLTAGKTSYTLTFTGASQIDMDQNFRYSYLIGTTNKVMTFYADVSEESPEAVTFYAVGSKSVTISVDGAGKSYKWSLGNAITMNPTEISGEKYSITVTGSEGDYVTVGINNVLQVKTEGNLLRPNENDVSGYLLKDVLNDQCFEIADMETIYKTQDLYVTGRIYNRIANVYLRDNSFKEIDGSSVLVTDGYYTKVLTSTGKRVSICVRFPDENYDTLKNIPFTFSVVEPTSNIKYSYYQPLVFGQIYRRIIPKSKIRSFGSLAPPVGKRVTLNVKAKSGFPKMYITKCKDYPFCSVYSDEALKGYTAPKKLNRMYTYSFEELPNEKAISVEKTVIIVKCMDDSNAENGYCDFEISFTTPTDELELVENDSLGQFALKGEKGSYKIGLEGDPNIRTVNIDIMVFSGDINFSIKSGTKTLDYYKYYLSNKMYFKITLQDTDDISEITLEYTATLNSYYTVKWNANRRGDGGSQYLDYITSGTSYLVSIDPTSSSKTKTIKLQNLRYKDGKPFFANFFALNCQFNLTREQQAISFFDGYAQEVITSSDPKYKSDYYDYSLTVTEPDSSNYNHKMCMIYVAGLEDNTTDIESEIVIAENINQQMIFERDKNYLTVRFLYPNPDITKDLALKVNVIDTEIYKVNIYIESTFLKSYSLSNTQIIYLSSSEFEFDNLCTEGNICAITVEVSFDTELDKTNPMAEITIRPILNTPTYLQKGQAKKDFVCGEKFYYLYTDIGKMKKVKF